MGVILTILAIVATVVIVSVTAISIGAVTIVRKLIGWGRRNHIPDKAMAQLDGMRSSAIAKQVTGSSGHRYLNPDDTRPWQVMSVVRPMRGDPILRPYAETVASSVDKVEFYGEGFEQVLEHEFGSGSLTWAKFHTPVTETLHEVVAVSARMANRMQMFDSTEYQRLRAYGTSEGTAESERLHVMENTLGDLGTMRDMLLRMTAGLERLHGELSQLSVSHDQGDCEMLLDEIHRLSNEAKLYA